MISSSRRSSTPNATIALQVIGRAAIVADSGSLVGLVALRQRSVGRRVDTGWQHGTNVQRILFIVAAGSPFAPTSLFSPASLVFVHHLSSNSCTMRHARRGGISRVCRLSGDSVCRVSMQLRAIFNMHNLSTVPIQPQTLGNARGDDLPNMSSKRPVGSCKSSSFG